MPLGGVCETRKGWIWMAGNRRSWVALRPCTGCSRSSFPWCTNWRMAQSWQALHRWWIASSFGCGTTLPVGLMKPCGTSDWRTVWPVVRGVVGFVWETKDVVIAVWWPRHTSQWHRLWKGVLVWPGSSICIGKSILHVWRRGWRQRRCLFVPRGFYCTRSR